MNFQPLGNRVLIELKPREEMVGGIYKPIIAQEDSTEGRVVAIGETVEHVAVGDWVLFGKYAGQKVNLQAGEFHLVNVSELLGKFTEAPKERAANALIRE